VTANITAKSTISFILFKNNFAELKFWYQQI